MVLAVAVVVLHLFVVRLLLLLLLLLGPRRGPVERRVKDALSVVQQHSDVPLVGQQRQPAAGHLVGPPAQEQERQQWRL